MDEQRMIELEMQTKFQEEKIKELTNSIKEFEHEIRLSIEKINEENNTIHGLVVAIENIVKQMEEQTKKIDKISDNQEDMSKKITAIEQAPAERALKLSEEIKKKVWLAIIFGAICFIFGFILPFPVSL